MVTIAVDAMGGDNAPHIEVEGALAASREFGVKILLVGREEVVRQELDKHSGWRQLPIEIVRASEVITMDDSAAKAVRAKKDSSIRVASRLVRDGIADGVVSAGNTGAVMATAKMVQGIVHGVERPSLATTLPTRTGNPAVLLDVGANVDSTPRMLAQFAVMGEVYARNILHLNNPRVGLLSIGEEEHKGNDLTKAATPLLKTLPINFIGNVEGRDLYKGTVDVVVCDGFTGNVALKISEGVADVITHMLKESLTSSALGKIGAYIARGAFRKFKRRVDYSEYGGAPLLGVKGVCIICHGSSNTNAMKNAIRVAAEFAREKLNAKIEDELHRWAATELAASAD
ncbi:MAG TPA: phosphate acyltransferase PlsX [Bryobacteraceae bacterium]|jgi:phosphate acyltransferase|nr:phosphate acyltransferase PlsX [Bryobacteraceae bacterium]